MTRLEHKKNMVQDIYDSAELDGQDVSMWMLINDLTEDEMDELIQEHLVTDRDREDQEDITEEIMTFISNK